jgi:putative phosphoesterase
VAALRGSDRILHAGDVGDPAILDRLRDIAPVTAIRGNIDRESWAAALPASDLIEIDGVSIYMLHDLAQMDLKPEAAGIRVVIYGHTHQPKSEHKNGVLYFNPGSAGPRRFRLPVTIGKLTIEKGNVAAEHVVLKLREN